MNEEERKAIQEKDDELGIGNGEIRIGYDILPSGRLPVQRIGRQDMLQVNVNGVFLQVSSVSLYNTTTVL